MAFLSPEPVTMNLSSLEMSLQRTEDVSLDWGREDGEGGGGYGGEWMMGRGGREVMEVSG